MAYRRRMSRRGSNKNFRRGSGSNRKNFASRPMRGGWRL